jgi:hypothetical protein
MTAATDFHTPLSDADQCAAVAMLAAGQGIRVDGVSLSVDLDAGVIWGCDPYGVDFLAAESIDRHGCLVAVSTSIARTPTGQRHPAEFSW